MEYYNSNSKNNLGDEISSFFYAVLQKEFVSLQQKSFFKAINPYELWTRFRNVSAEQYLSISSRKII
jgi:hypothetical protein